MIKSSSFESPKPDLFAQYIIKNSISSLLRYVIMAQSNPILHHTEGLVTTGVGTTVVKRRII